MWQEAWKQVAGYEGQHEVSSLGRVRGVCRIDGRGVVIPERVLNGTSKSGGYRIVNLRRGRKDRRMASVHRLVADAFVPNPENKPCVNHIDNDPANNHAANLEWCTQRENIEHMDRQGRRSIRYGVRPSHAKLTNAQVEMIRQASASGEPYSKLSAAFAVSKRTIGRIVTGVSYV